MISFIRVNWSKLRLRQRKIESSGLVYSKFKPNSVLNVVNHFVFGAATLGDMSSRTVESHLIIEAGGVLTVDSATIGRGSRVLIGENAKVTIGHSSYLSDNCFVSVATELKIGNGCFISWAVQIIDDDGHEIDGKPTRKPITIEDNVWVGSQVSILKGTFIGKGCVVAAGAVVSGKFPENCLIAGVPAKVIREKINWK